MKRVEIFVLFLGMSVFVGIVSVNLHSASRTVEDDIYEYSAGPPGEAGYPSGQIITVRTPVRISNYFSFLDSIAAQQSHLRHHNLPGERLIALANSGMMNNRIRLADAHPDSVILASGSRLNIPDSLTALSFRNTLRTSVLWLDCTSSQAFVTAGPDTLFCASFQMTDSMGRWDTSGSMTGVVLRAHRKTCGYFPCEHSRHQPALEITLKRIPIPLIITSEDNRHFDLLRDGFNFIWFANSDIWLLYYLAPPGTPVRWNVVERENAVRIRP